MRQKVLRSYFFLAFTLFLFSEVRAQEKKSLSGTVSFVTSQYVYLKFENTESINAGDTVSVKINNQPTPCLIILQKSSISCAAEIIGNCPVEQGTEVVVRTKIKKVSRDKEKKTKLLAEVSTDTAKASAQTENLEKFQNVNGRVSFANYCTGDGANSNNRTTGRFYLKANNILNTKLNFTTYTNYNTVNKTIPSGSTRNSRFNVFQFDLSYQGDSGLSVSLGRKINSKFASLGAVDGIQAEKKINNWFVGGLTGFRPNPISYTIDATLFQLGIYTGIYHNKSHNSFTTLGFANQQNSGNIDRRYLFVQHQSNLTKSLGLFASAETDLYSADLTGTATNNPKLTSAYASLSYRINQKLKFYTSLDFRSNLILYQSYAESLPFLLKNNPNRIGFRTRLNYQLTKTIYTGFSFNQRFQSDKNNSFNNYSAYVTFARLFGGRLNANYNHNKNQFFKYQSYSARYSHLMLHKKLDFSTYFRFNYFNYTNSTAEVINQYYIGTDLHYNITKKLSAGAMYEFSSKSSITINRFNLNVIQRF